MQTFHNQLLKVISEMEEAVQTIVMAGFFSGAGVRFQSYTEPGYAERSN